MDTILTRALHSVHFDEYFNILIFGNQVQEQTSLPDVQNVPRELREAILCFLSTSLMRVKGES